MFKKRSTKLTCRSLVSFAAVSSLLFSSPSAYATDVLEMMTETNGYTSIVIDTNAEQKDPLQTVLTIRIPSQIKNVGQAMNFVLQNSGYELESFKITEPETFRLYSLAISATHRQFHSANVIQIIEALAGKGFSVHANHIRRTISIIPRV